MFLLNLQGGVSLANAPFLLLQSLIERRTLISFSQTAALKQHCMSVSSPLLDSSIMCKIPRGTALVWDTIDVDRVRLDSILNS
jgi:hypothetical protein